MSTRNPTVRPAPAPTPKQRKAVRELRALLAAAPLRASPVDEPPAAPDAGPREPWGDCGWYDSSWSLRSGLQVKECEADEWAAARAAA